MKKFEPTCFFCNQSCTLSEKGFPEADVWVCKDCPVEVDHWYDAEDNSLGAIALICIINNRTYEVCFYMYDNKCAVFEISKRNNAPYVTTLTEIYGFNFHPNFTPQNIVHKLKTVLTFQ